MIYEIKQPYQHHVYSAKIRHFEIVVDIEFEDGISNIVINSSIGDVVFFFDKFTTRLDFNDSFQNYTGDAFIQYVVDLSKERLNELLSKVKA